MSETEHMKGNLKKIIIPKNYDTWKKQVKYLQSKKYHFDDLNFDDEYFYLNDSNIFYHIKSKTWYSMEVEEIDPDYEICKTNINGNIIDFELRYYNGGTSFDEMLEEALDDCFKIENGI